MPDEIVAIYISADQEIVGTKLSVTVEQVSVYVSEGTGGAGGGSVVRNKLYYTATGLEFGIINVPGFGTANFTLVRQGVTDLKEVMSVHFLMGNTYMREANGNVLFGNAPLGGEQIYFEWQ
jgi:hypothetical protein